MTVNELRHANGKPPLLIGRAARIGLKHRHRRPSLWDRFQVWAFGGALPSFWVPAI